MNITSQDNALYTLDRLANVAYGVIISKSGQGIDCTQAAKIKGLDVTANTPAGTDIHCAFSTGDKWFSLDTSGNASPFSDTVPDYTALTLHGNSIAQLKALTSIPAFAGKVVRVAAALSSSDINNAVPTLKLSAKASTSTQLTTYTEYSPVYELGDNSSITDIPAIITTAPGGSVTLTGKITRDDDSVTDWLTPEQLKGLKAKDIQLRAVYQVATPGSGSACLEKCTVNYSQGNSAYSGGKGRLYSVTEDWYTPVKSVRINVRHSPLDDSAMKLYVSFRPSPKHIVRENLGIANGYRQTLQLAQKGGIRYDTFRLYIDGQEISNGFELNGEVSKVTFTAPEGSVITASYDSGWTKEKWQEMTRTNSYSLADYDVSEYTLEDDSNTYTVAAFMAEIESSSGKADNESLPRATGRTQTVQLAHYATSVTKLQYNTGSGWTDMRQSSYALMDDTRLLRFAAPAGASMRASYDWTSAPVRLWEISAVFSG